MCEGACEDVRMCMCEGVHVCICEGHVISACPFLLSPMSLSLLRFCFAAVVVNLSRDLSQSWCKEGP